MRILEHWVIYILSMFLVLDVVVSTGGAEDNSHAELQCHMSEMAFDPLSSIVTVGVFAVKFDNPEPLNPPSIWEGPLLIKDRGENKVCAVDPGGLINRPLFAFDNRFLVLMIFSGNNFQIATVDLQECRVQSLSAKMAGPIALEGNRITAAGRPILYKECSER